MPLSLELAALGGLSLVLMALAAWILFQVKERSPQRRERRRRRYINDRGRLADALITEATPNVIYYDYTVHGVRYTASQDIADLQDRLPDQPERLIGAANVKYSQRNPANSILICEEWSGLRVPAIAGPRS